MKSRLLFVFAVLLAASMFATATPADCVAGTLDTYLTPNFECKIDNLKFSNWGYSNPANPTGIAIPSTAVQVKLITNLFNEGFEFAASWNVGTQLNGNQSTQDSLISFTVCPRSSWRRI